MISKAKNGIPVVAYYRMSSDKQERSIADQRRMVQKYAKDNGYNILREYVDEGISGDRTEKRVKFQKMIADAEKLGDFEAIIVWKQDRFGRFNSIEAGHWIYPLFRAGVTKLVTAADGVIDWRNESDRMMYGIKQDASGNRYLRDLSQNILRSKMDAAANGYWVGGPAPFGYDRMYVDEAGKHKQRVRNGEKYAKPTKWRVVLVPSDDEEKLDAVRWLFTTYDTKKVSLNSLARGLNQRGHTSPYGKTWDFDTVGDLLCNPVYAGDLVWNKERRNKYFGVSGGEIKETHDLPKIDKEAGNRSGKYNPESDWIVKRDAVERIVSRAMAERVRDKVLSTRKKNQRRQVKSTYPLSGLVFCGNCGSPMDGSSGEAGGHRYTYYKCRKYQMDCRRGVKPECTSNCIAAHGLLEVVLAGLCDCVLGPKSVSRIHSLVQAMAKQRTSGPSKAEVRKLKKQIADLSAQESQAKRNLFLLDDPTLLPAAREVMEELRAKREALEGELATLEAPAEWKGAKPREVADKAIAELGRLETHLNSQDPALVKEALSRLVDRVDLYFDTKECKKRVKSIFSSGCVTFRHPLDSFGDIRSTSKRPAPASMGSLCQ